MSNEIINLEFLSRQAKRGIEETRAIRKDVASVMRLVSSSYEITRRFERGQIELGGALAKMQTTLETSLERVEQTVGQIAEHVEQLENPR